MTVESAEPCTCWVVTDGAAGNERQALALAHALGQAPRVLRVSLRAPWRWLAPTGPRDPCKALAHIEGGQIQAPWPELLIGCGRQSAGIALGVRRLSGQRTRLVQILDPRRHRHDFDVVVVPEHDGLSGDNVITTRGALNAIDDDWLHDAREQFAALAKLPSPRITVLVGGPTRHCRFGNEYLDDIIDALERSRPAPASWLVTCSRRTPPTLVDHLRQRMAGCPGVFWAGDADGPNPYAGLLAWAEAIVVTPDSSNLLSEACATGAPTFVHRPELAGGKIATLLRSLIDGGRIHPLPYTTLPKPSQPLRELASVADRIRQRLHLP